MFPSNRVKPRGKEPAQTILRLASLKAPDWFQSKCPVAMPGLSLENRVCRVHSFTIRFGLDTEDEEEELSPGQTQAASWEATAGLTWANVPWRSKQDKRKLGSELAALVS